MKDSVIFYFWGIFGAGLYYLMNATSIWSALVGMIKALVWPAVVVYNVFDMLKL